MNFARCPRCNKICSTLKTLTTTKYILVDGKAKKTNFITKQYKCPNHKYFTTDENGNPIGRRFRYDFKIIDYAIKLIKQDWTFKEISDKLGIPQGTIKNWMRWKNIKVSKQGRRKRKREFNEINLEVAEYDSRLSALVLLSGE